MDQVINALTPTRPNKENIEIASTTPAATKEEDLNMDELTKKIDALLLQTAEKEKRERLEFGVANAGVLPPIPLNAAGQLAVTVGGSSPADSTAVLQYVLLCFRSGDSWEGASVVIQNETEERMLTMSFCDTMVQQVGLLTGVSPHFEFDSKDAKNGTLSLWYSEEEFKNAW